jgi:hypothetical protein
LSIPECWTIAIEQSIFNDVVWRVAPNLPVACASTASLAKHAVVTPEETGNILDHWIWIAGHDTHIVRSLGNAAQLHAGLGWKLMIARQMGDDGAHAEFLRNYIRERTGDDPVRRIEEIADMHGEMLGDLPWRNIYSFVAWELHYEFYLLARLMTERRTARLYDPGIAEFAATRIGPDEEEHRLRIMNWVLDWYRGLDQERREAVAAQIICYDNEIQRRLRSYLGFRYRQSALSLNADVRDAGAVYDGFRQGVLLQAFGIVSDGLVEFESVGEIAC